MPNSIVQFGRIRFRWSNSTLNGTFFGLKMMFSAWKILFCSNSTIFGRIQPSNLIEFDLKNPQIWPQIRILNWTFSVEFQIIFIRIWKSSELNFYPIDNFKFPFSICVPEKSDPRIPKLTKLNLEKYYGFPLLF